MIGTVLHNEAQGLSSDKKTFYLVFTVFAR